jgi:DNA replication protein DnaC
MDKSQLINNLRSLRLPGVIDSLDERVSEANEHELSYLEFLSLLTQDERLSRDNSHVGKLIRQAGFGPIKTFEDFDFSFNPEHLPKKILMDLRNCSFIDEGQNIVIAGPPGIGKSHIVKAVGHSACRRKRSVAYRNTVKMLQYLQTQTSERLLQKEYKRLINCELLILDDFALKKYSTKEAEIIYSIVDERQGIRSVMLTSNRSTEDWYHAFPDQVIGGALLDRLVSGAMKLYVKSKAKSYRKAKGKTIFTGDPADTINEGENE